MTFLAVVTAIAGVYSILTDLFLRDRSRVNRRIDLEFVKRQRDLARKLSLFKDPAQIGVEVQATTTTAAFAGGSKRWSSNRV